MENTSCGSNCAFVKSGFCQTDKECPHFVQSLWQKEGDPMPKIVSDCYPKKFILEQNQLLHRFLCMQSVTEELRHKVSTLEDAIKQLCNILSLKANNSNNNLILDDKESFKRLE
jgi:hypothetical protein